MLNGHISAMIDFVSRDDVKAGNHDQRFLVQGRQLLADALHIVKDIARELLVDLCRGNTFLNFCE